MPTFSFLTLYSFMCGCGMEFQSLGPSDVNLSVFVGSQTLSLPKDSQTKVASGSGGIRENWGESSMADASPRTDTSTDDTEDKNHRVMSLTYVGCSGIMIIMILNAQCIYKVVNPCKSAALTYIFLICLENCYEYLIISFLQKIRLLIGYGFWLCLLSHAAWKESIGYCCSFWFEWQIERKNRGPKGSFRTYHVDVTKAWHYRLLIWFN